MQHSTLIVRQVGRQPYLDVNHAMHQFTDRRTSHTVDEIWFVEHPPVYTQGQAGKAEHLLMQTTIPVIQSDRGGQITYHGYGQLVLYVLLNLHRHKMTVRRLITQLEQTVIKVLSQLNIEAKTCLTAPGVYVQESKICSLGLRIRHGCSLHGLALNVDMDLTPFDAINPCGYAGLNMTQITHFNDAITLPCVESLLLQQFIQQFSYHSVCYRAWRKTDYD